jgi:broad specificity phosphatase PhoE
MQKTTFFFIRHGQSLANVQQLVTGDLNDTLASQGIEQALLARIFFEQFFKIQQIKFNEFYQISHSKLTLG